MTLTELITAARLELDDVDDGTDSRDLLWSDDELVRWANQAQEEAVRRAFLLYDDSSVLTQITLNITDSIYPVDERVIRVTGAKLLSGSNPFLRSANKTQLDERDPTWGQRVGEPQKYVNFKRTIKLDKIPAVVDTLQLEAYVLPTIMDIGGIETLDIETKHHESLIFWIKHRAYEKQDTETLNPELSAISGNKFTSRFGQRKSAMEEEVIRTEQPRRVAAQFF